MFFQSSLFSLSVILFLYLSLSLLLPFSLSLPLSFSLAVPYLIVSNDDPNVPTVKDAAAADVSCTGWWIHRTVTRVILWTLY